MEWIRQEGWDKNGLNNGIVYLNAGVLGTAVDDIQIRRIDNGEDVAHIMVGVNRIKSLKSTSQPYLEGKPSTSRSCICKPTRIPELTYIDDGITST